MASPQKQGVPFLILSLSFFKLHNISKAPPRRTAISIFASLRNIENYLFKTKRLKDIIHRHLPDCIAQSRWRLATEIYTLQIRTASKDMFHHVQLGIIWHHDPLQERVSSKGTILQLIYTITHTLIFHSSWYLDDRISIIGGTYCNQTATPRLIYQVANSKLSNHIV